ncbi:hypothetical protein SCB49_11152 [unidentified eubacterium SCB49]|nr:hypothetical protein SCB49_11152 [unidentified eubacterium SCB49]
MKTNTIKSSFKFLAFLGFLGLFVTSCSSDDEGVTLANAPEIISFEFGEGASHTTDQVGYKGTDLHVEAEINAEAVVSSITLSIHSHDLPLGDDEVDWDFTQTFEDADYQVINPEFHEHVDIPENIPAGEYHIELLVIDELGNSTEIDGHLEVLEHPIALSDIHIDSTVVRGDDFHVEFFINAENGINNIELDIHAHDLPIGDGEVEWDYEEEFQEGYHLEEAIEFHKHIVVPSTAPAGEYHIIITVEDEAGFTKEYETHIDVTA